MNSLMLEKLMVITPEEQVILDGRSGIDAALYMEHESTVIDCRKLLDEGRLISLRPHTRFVRFPRHTHNYVEVIYMCCGSTTHRINGQEVVLRQGELLFLNQHAVQEIEAAGREDLAVNFIILPEFFDTSLHMMGDEENLVREFLISCLKSRDPGRDFLHFRVSEVLVVQNLVENLIWSLVNTPSGRSSTDRYTMGLLFLTLMNQTDKVGAGGQQGSQDLVLSVLNFVEEQYRDGELGDLAARLGVGLNWLSREIKKRTGKNYTDLVQLKRLGQAAWLLRTTGLSVYEIGLRVGYENLSYFHRIFQSRFGCSPKKYRDSLHRDPIPGLAVLDGK